MARNKPVGKNSVPSVQVLFTDRVYYTYVLSEIIREYGVVPFGDLQVDNALFGLIDNYNNIVKLKKEFLVKAPSANQKEQRLQDFVLEAFLEMKNYLSTAAKLGKISNTSPYYDIKIHKSYSDPDTDAIVNSVLYVEEFKKNIISDNKKNSSITNHKDFTKHFINFLKNKIQMGYKVTKGGCILANNFVSFSSGLIFDIATDKTDDDEIKYDNYLNIPDFSVFNEACIRFGFKIDSHVPWRLYADLNSPAMIQETTGHKGYLLRKNIISIDQLFRDRYDLVMFEEIDFLKKMFFDSYKYFLKENTVYDKDYSKICSKDVNDGTLLLRQEVTKEKYYKDYPDTFWLRLFAFFKNYEVKSNLTQQVFENMVREANNYVEIQKNAAALSYLNKKFRFFTFPKHHVIKYEIVF